MGCVESREPSVPHQKCGQGPCTKCSKTRNLFSLTYQEGPESVTLTQQCFTCLNKAKYWVRMDRDEAIVHAGLGWSLKYHLQGQCIKKHSETNLLQCQLCSGYEHTVFDLHFPERVCFYTTQKHIVTSQDLRWQHNIKSVCEQCVAVICFTHLKEQRGIDYEM